MTPAVVLFRHSLVRMRAMIAVAAAGLAAFQVLLAFAAAELQRSGAFDQIMAFVPAFVRDLFGSALAGMMSFSGIMALGYYHVAVVAVLVGLTIAVATEPAAEIEAGVADLFLSRAVPRGTIVIRTALMILVAPGLVVAAMAAGTFLGLWWATPPGASIPGPSLVGRIACSLWSLLVACGGLALVAGAASRRRSVAGATAGGIAAAAMLVDYLSKVWAPLLVPARLSPFHYYNPLDLVVGRPVPSSDVWVLLAAGAAGASLAWVIFVHRDV